MNGPPCWKFKYEFEELLNIRKDSTYLLLHLKPQGGFEVLPDSGKWEIKKEKIILHSVTNLEWKSAAYITRTFKISSLGLYEKKSIIYNKKNFWKKLP